MRGFLFAVGRLSFTEDEVGLRFKRLAPHNRLAARNYGERGLWVLLLGFQPTLLPTLCSAKFIGLRQPTPNYGAKPESKINEAGFGGIIGTNT